MYSLILLLVFSDMRDRLEMFASEEDLENASLYEPSSYVGVVFMDNSATSYRLRFPYNQLPLPSDYTESFGKLILLYSIFSPMHLYRKKCILESFWRIIFLWSFAPFDSLTIHEFNRNYDEKENILNIMTESLAGQTKSALWETVATEISVNVCKPAIKKT